MTDRSAAVIRAMTSLLIDDPRNIICFDFVDLGVFVKERGRAYFGEGEAEGPDRAIRAADAAIDDIRRQISQAQRGVDMSDTPPRDNSARDNDGRSIGEGPERRPDGTYNKSGIAQREQAQKEAGNPKEKQAEAERISREEAHYRRGFPVAGHGEPEPENDPGRERSR